MSATVHVIDDDEAVRESLCFLLETAGYATRAWPSGEDFLRGERPRAGDAVITDVRMPGRSGVEIAAILRQEGSPAPIIMVTGHADVPLAVQAMKAGAADFIEKPFDEEAILGSLANALRQAAAPEHDGIGGDIGRRLSELSARERQVLEGLVAGKANKVVAQDLGISPRTVEVYRANVMTKMQASSLSELVRMAIQAGLAV